MTTSPDEKAVEVQVAERSLVGRVGRVVSVVARRTMRLVDLLEQFRLDGRVAGLMTDGHVSGHDGEAVFAEPWEGRAFALAVQTVERMGLPWDEFRRRLIAEIAIDPHRPYYQSWLAALERLVLEHQATDAAGLAEHRMRSASYRTDEPGGGDTEIFPITVTETTVRGALDAMFLRWWPNIRFGPIIQGAVYELRAPHEPEMTMLDGYLTIGFEGWHVHLCVGEHVGPPGHLVSPQLARQRLCTYAELAREFVDDAPTSWMFRMYNGAGEQMLTVLLPNPFLDDDQHLLAEPDWARLACWDELRHDLLDLPPDPVDRLGTGFRHP
jgi:nitrile hydratase accessory protein